MFDNIPLTKLALEQGGYDWGVLAYAVGFGGSMIWFGSSAGVAVSNLFPEAKSVGQWLRQGWYVAVGYVVGFLVLMSVLGWNPCTLLTAVTPAIPGNRVSHIDTAVSGANGDICGRIGRHGRNQSHHPRAEAGSARTRHHLRHAGASASR